MKRKFNIGDRVTNKHFSECLLVASYAPTTTKSGRKRLTYVIKHGGFIAYFRADELQKVDCDKCKYRFICWTDNTLVGR